MGRLSPIITLEIRAGSKVLVSDNSHFRPRRAVVAAGGGMTAAESRPDAGEPASPRRPGRPVLAADARVELVRTIVTHRLAGRSYREIADLVGASKSFVGAICTHVATCPVVRGLIGGPAVRRAIGG